MASETVTRVDSAVLRRQVSAILSAWGMDPDDVRVVTDVIIETDLRGIDSHGVSMLPLYAQMRTQGKLNPKARPRIVRETATMAVIDADAGLGHAVSRKAMALAVDKCLSQGCGIVTVFNSHHFGAAGIYAQAAAERGVIGLVATSTRFVILVPTFAAGPVLGTNPIAFAAPTGNEPVVLDMATTTVAAGKVKTYWLNDRPLPEGWVVDGNGRPVTNSDEGYKTLFERPEGGLTPLGGTRESGGHKGYGLALMVHILAGVLAGASFSPIRNRSQAPNEPDNIGHFFLAIDPKAFRPDGGFEADLSAVVEVLHHATPADSAQPVLVAGDPERTIRVERLKLGIPIPGKLHQLLRDVARESGAEFLLGNEAG